MLRPVVGRERLVVGPGPTFPAGGLPGEKTLFSFKMKKENGLDGHNRPAVTVGPLARLSAILEREYQTFITQPDCWEPWEPEFSTASMASERADRFRTHIG